jgi:hypothetical protein
MRERLDVLTAIYQSDRADRAANLTVVLATMGVAVTYLVGTIAFYDKLDLLGWTIALLPFPLVCVAAYHSQLIHVTAARARSILTLERALLAATQPAPADVDARHIGATASERAINVHLASGSQRLTILIAYGGVGAIYLAYLVFMLIKAGHFLGGWVAIAAAAYLVLLAPIGLAWYRSTRLLNFPPVTPAGSGS